MAYTDILYGVDDFVATTGISRSAQSSLILASTTTNLRTKIADTRSARVSDTSPLPPNQCIDRGNNGLSPAALVPPQIAALVQPLDRVVVEHAGEQGADDGPWVLTLAASQQAAPIALSTARS